MHSKQKKNEEKYVSSAALLQASALLLQKAGLRPTRQRIALANWLFDGCDKHVTAEQTYEASVKGISLATVYNTLNSFTEAGLLRQVVIDGGQVYFDTNTSAHHHLFDEDSGRLTDIPAGAVRVAQLPSMPRGKILSRVDVIVRVHAKV